MDTDTSSIRRKYFDLKRWIKKLSLRRPLRTMMLGLIALLPNGELTTERFPVTYERLQEETGYSRSQVIALMQELRELGHVRIHKQPYRLPDGRKWNRANVYEIVISDGADVDPTKQSKKAQASSQAPSFPTPITKPTRVPPAPPESPSVEPIEYEFAEPPDGYYEALIAEQEAQEQSTITTPVVEAAPEPHAPPNTPDWLAPVPPPLHPEPIGTIDEKTRVVTPQSPEGFTDEEQAVAHELKRYANARLDPMCRGPKSSEALQAKLAFVGAVYSLGRTALNAQVQYGISINENLACVDEWIAKCLTPRVGHHQLALRLNKFLLAKGENIERMRLKRWNEFVKS